MASINNYRFGSYAILAMGLINLRYQTGSEANLSKSSVLIAVATVVIRQEPLLVDVTLSGVTFHATPSKELITTVPFAAGLTWP